MEVPVKATVDQDLCIGCGLCAETCPEVFEMTGDKATVIANPVPAGAEASAQQASEECPVTAITIE